MQNIENPLYQKEISPAFLQKVEYVRKRIFDNCAPKKGFTEGSIVSGFRKFTSYYHSLMKEGPLWIVFPSPHFASVSCYGLKLVNPWRMHLRVTVVILSVCLCVYLSVATKSVAYLVYTLKTRYHTVLYNVFKVYAVVAFAENTSFKSSGIIC